MIETSLHIHLSFSFCVFNKTLFYHKLKVEQKFNLFADCVSFCHENRTFKRGKRYDLKTRPDLCGQDEHSTTASELNAAKPNSQAGFAFSLDLIEETIRTKLEPLHAQNSALTQMMDNLIQCNLARAYPMASARDRRFQSEYPLTQDPGISRTLPLVPSVTAGCSSDTFNYILSYVIWWILSGSWSNSFFSKRVRKTNKTIRLFKKRRAFRVPLIAISGEVLEAPTFLLNEVPVWGRWVWEPTVGIVFAELSWSSCLSWWVRGGICSFRGSELALFLSSIISGGTLSMF